MAGQLRTALRACLSTSAGPPICLVIQHQFRLAGRRGEQMWTDRYRTRHEARLKDMVLQAGLDEVAHFLKRADPPGRPEATAERQVLAGIAWHLRTGGGWRALPAGFPLWRTVYRWFRRWIEKGLFESLMQALARRQRRRCGRRPDPRLAIIDTQSVKYIGVRGPRG